MTHPPGGPRTALLSVLALLVVSGWPAAEANAQNPPGDIEGCLAEARVALRKDDPQKALTLLGGIPGLEENGDAWWSVQELKFRVLQRSLTKSASAGSANPEVMAKLHSQFEVVKEAALACHIAPAPGTQELTAAFKAVRLQRVLVSYAETLSYSGMAKEATVAFRKACQSFLDSEELLNTPIQASMRAPDGAVTRRTVPLWQREGLPSLELTRLDGIAAAEAWLSSSGSNQAKQAVLQTLDEFLAKHPDSPWAGTKTSRCMRLRGNFDLDKLVEAYAKCRDKEHPQYVYSTLGLAGLLADAGRSAQALEYLKRIEGHGVPAGRQAEFHYTMGRTLADLHDDERALKYLRKAQQLGNAFDVAPIIRRVTKQREEQDDSVRQVLESPALTIPSSAEPAETMSALPVNRQDGNRDAAEAPDAKSETSLLPMTTIAIAATAVLVLLTVGLALFLRRARRSPGPGVSP